MAQTTVISFFKYKGRKNKWQALGRMGRPPIADQDVEGLSFWKPLGIGSGNGFSIWPDFSMFALLTVFDSEEQAKLYLNSEFMYPYTEDALGFGHILMHTIKAHGQWTKEEPFISGTKFDPKRPIAVITRATIKPKLAHKFWRYVPSVSKSMNSYEDLLFTKGIGEYPLLMQATYSLWKNGESMMDYAYKNEKHAAMVKKTRELGWYSEELFSRFHPFEIIGNMPQLKQISILLN
ncbi:MAG: hypothetical protein AAGH46_12545 [Bacteroidota bacterium]